MKLIFSRSDTRRALAGALVMIGLATGSVPAGAQGVDCRALKAEIDASGDAAARSGQIAAALRRQETELQRIQNYADSIGCNSGFFFGNGPPACDRINARIEQMQSQIGRMQQDLETAGDSDGTGRRDALAERYDAFCAGGPADGAEQPYPNLDAMPPDPDRPDGQPSDAGPPQPERETKALCVRHCDGGFFPITDQASPDKLDGLGQLCKALCPNAEASLYTTAPSGSIDTAVAADGTPYTALPNAFKFQKTYDPACSCKPPHQSWVEALAGAEKLLEADKNDLTVTQQMSDAMSRPVLPPASGKTARPAKPGRKPKPQPADAHAAPNFASQPGGPGENPGEDVMRQLRRADPTF